MNKLLTYLLTLVNKTDLQIQPWWLGGRVLNNVQTKLMLCFSGSNPAWEDDILDLDYMQ